MIDSAKTLIKIPGGFVEGVKTPAKIMIKIVHSTVQFSELPMIVFVISSGTVFYPAGTFNIPAYSLKTVVKASSIKSIPGSSLILHCIK